MKVTEVEIQEEEYEDLLNSIYGEVNVCEMVFDAGHALRKLDPTAFRCGLNDRPPRYKCGECGRTYEDEDPAEACCQN